MTQSCSDRPPKACTAPQVALQVQARQASQEQTASLQSPSPALQVPQSRSAPLPLPPHTLYLSFSKAGWFCRLGRLADRRPVSVLRLSEQCTRCTATPPPSPAGGAMLLPPSGCTVLLMLLLLLSVPASGWLSGCSSARRCVVLMLFCCSGCMKAVSSLSMADTWQAKAAHTHKHKPTGGSSRTGHYSSQPLVAQQEP